MSIFKYILSPFVEFNETAESKPAVQSGNTAAVNVAPANRPSAPVAAAGADTNGDFNGYFERLIEEANQKNPIFQGTDLKEYLDAKVELDSITDEQAKIRTAFNVLKNTGLTKDKLLTTGREYIRLIEADLAGIESAFMNQYKSDVELKEQQVQAKAQELQQLNARINSLSQEISELSDQVKLNKTKLTDNKNQFILAGQNKKSQIEAEIQKINQYL